MPQTILVTGASGFLGRHTVPVLKDAFKTARVVGVSSRDYNLMDRSVVERMFNDIQPDVVVHYAAYSGGIGANRTYPGDFYYQNTILTAHAFDVAARRGDVKKFIYTMGGCSYPAQATSPIDENQLWQGYPQNESAGYSTAKMMGTVAAKSYRDQFGLNAVVLIPGNLYGEYDNFTSLDSHVVPAMIRRYYEAQRDKLARVEMWGTGAPQRDFVYAGDVAKLIPWFIENYDSSDPVNISAGRTTPIRELAETIAKLVDFKGEIAWDALKPDGQMVKIFDTSRLNGLGLSCATPLRDGLTKTIRWFDRNYETGGDGLRL
jgi:GDP-L-fucose synthase